ncbi:MAG: S-adenosylmethionine:tRNA ribosyltransferase-isomerase [Vulcanimicrobiaceae bacterium]
MSALPFELPRELEAAEPPEARGVPRDAVALLVSDVPAGTHHPTTFARLDEHLRSGDLLIVNDSATIAAALDAERSDGTSCVVHLSTQINASLWIVEPRESPDVRAGDILSLAGGGTLRLLTRVHREHARLWYATLALPSALAAYLRAHGRPIAYSYVTGSWPLPVYQTIFGRSPGSVEMPSAARPFTSRVIARLRQRGIDVAAITLHCGVASIETHEPPLEERFQVGAATVHAVERTRRRGGRIVAVGTTAVRALESATGDDGVLRPRAGWTRHIVDAEHPPRIADGILTGLHEPRASHLMMLEAFASREFLQSAYQIALRERLLWHEFGDLHLILRV